MQRQIATYTLAPGQYKTIKRKMLDWATQFSIFLFLDSNDYASAYGRYECLLGAGSLDAVNAVELDALQSIIDNRRDWMMGHIGYDYKNNIEHRLSSRHEVRLGFPQLRFFCPKFVCYIGTGKESLTIATTEGVPDEIYQAILDQEIIADNVLPPIHFERRIGRETYLDTIGKLRNHIAEGDCYEINYCVEGFADAKYLDAISVFKKLNALSPAPFAACYRLNDLHMMCSSPERYLQKATNKLIAQPIKGTARRDADKNKDEQIKNHLRDDIKERAENVMIVDLMRNDLARCCEVGSIEVEELFGIYSFPQVHQMISTISGKLKDKTQIKDIVRYTFPMGSMTGAPKIKVMELIDEYEQSRRELFSGTVGYITPEGDFDFNVVIRSLFYNETNGYLSYQTGGAITYDSIPGNEWEEMKLKAWAMERIFQA